MSNTFHLRRVHAGPARPEDPAALSGALRGTTTAYLVAECMPFELVLERRGDALVGRIPATTGAWLSRGREGTVEPGTLAWAPDDRLVIFLSSGPAELDGAPVEPIGELHRTNGALTELADMPGPLAVQLEDDTLAPTRTLRELIDLDPLPVTRVTRTLTVGSGTTQRDLERLVRDGYASVLNLSSEGESPRWLSPNVEATWAHALLLAHARLSVDPEQPVDPALFARFEGLLAKLPAPIYAHSSTGRRAVAFAAAHLAVEENLDAETALDRLEERGLSCEAPELRAFVARALERYRTDAPDPFETVPAHGRSLP